MVYYIDVQPVKKKAKNPMKRIRVWVYSIALIISVCVVIPFLGNTKSAVMPIEVSSTEYKAADVISVSDAFSEISVRTFSNYSSPLDSAYISSPYGYRTNPVSGKYKLHGGLDLAAGEGSPIYAVLDGEVTTSAYSESYGNYVLIDHKNGYETLYAHCSKLLCSTGDLVSCKDIIALVGSTGNSTGPHLHIEIRQDGNKIDPEIYFGEFFL